VFRERYGIAATREFGGAWNCNGMTAATIGIDVGTSAARVQDGRVATHAKAKQRMSRWLK